MDRLESDYGYSEREVNNLHHEIASYNKIKEMVKLASSDYIDIKPYEADMRYILDTYIRTEDSTVITSLEDMSLVELIVNRETTTPIEQVLKGIFGDDDAKVEIIDGNLEKEIIKRKSVNEVYYGKLSEMLEDVITKRKIGGTNL